MHAVVDLPAAPTSPRVARRFVTTTLDRWGREDLELPATMVATELVTNGVLHARTEMQLTLSVHEAALRVEVHDHSPVPPIAKNYDVESVTGRGLALVQRLSRAWGVRRDDHGKTVWAEIVEVSWEELDALVPVEDDLADVRP